MMGFLDKVKKAFGSKKEDESQNKVNDEVIDEPTFTESIENDNGNFNDNEEIQSEESEETPANEEIIDKPTPNEKIRNFKYLDDLIHSGAKEIVLDYDIVLGSDEKSQYLQGIGLDVDDLVIDGNGHTVDAQGKARIFYCTGKNITIKNIILKNGFAKKDGGVILNDCGVLTIIGSTFTGNTAQEGDGGSIYNWKNPFNSLESVLTIIESTFMGNTAHKSGGAICNFYGELTITSSAFTGNTAHESGGSINNSGKLIITDSTFMGNTAHKSGGVIDHEEGELKITSSTLNNNVAKEKSGAIHHEKGESTMADSTLTENKAQLDGVICLNNGSFKIYNCEFSSNKSNDNIILNNDSLQIHNTTFKFNKSKHVVLNDGGANLGIFNGEFKENNVEKSVLCNSGRFCSVERTVFENNISNNKLDNIINESELTLTNPKIKDNVKSILNQNYIFIRKSSPELQNIIYGEGTVEVDEKIIPQGESFDFGYLDKKIHKRNTREIILDYDITFENYERDFYEGGIELDIDNLIIDGNGKTINGLDKSRIFIITGKNITLRNIVFKNGYSHKNYDNSFNNNGGAIKINFDNNIKIENCEFINNISEEDGGAIKNQNGKLTINESTFTGNTAHESGGAIKNQKGKLKIIESTFIGNTSQGSGFFSGGGAIRQDKGESTIIESTINNNTAKHGGAIYNRESKLKITSSTLNSNIAQDGYGGAIDNWMSVLTITDSTLTGNTAQYNGGAIDHDNGELTIIDSTLTGNTSKCGGAIHNNQGELTITDSTLMENTAHESGGAIALTISKKYESNNCTFKDNNPDDVYGE